MSTIKKQPLRVLTDLTANLKAQIDAQRTVDEDYSREITIRLSAIDAILAHCSLCVFNNDPEVEEEDEDDVDLATLAQQVFGSEVAEPGATEGEAPVSGALPDPAYQIPDGIYRMEFDTKEDRSHIAISDLQAVVVDGPEKGARVAETLAFAPMYTDHHRAARAKARRYAQIFGVAESETDCEHFHFRPFIAEVRNGVIVEVGVDSHSHLPSGKPRKLEIYTRGSGAEFEPIAA